MRNFARLGVDLAWVAISAFLAVLIRDNLVASVPRLQAVAPYAVLSLASAAIVFTVARLNRTIWRYTSLRDALQLLAAVTVALLLALLAGFALNRLEGVARSVPIIQWLVLVGALIGTRIAVRLWQEKGDKSRKLLEAPAPLQHVLVVGVNNLTELYLSSMSEFAPANFAVIGLLSSGRALQGRSVRRYRVLGAAEDLMLVLAQLDIHGVTVDRIIVMQPFEKLSTPAKEAILEVERSTAIKVEWILETLGWSTSGSLAEADVSTAPETTRQLSVSTDSHMSLPGRRYALVKRAIDFAAAICLVVALWPILLLVSVVVAIDVGLPIVFWQQRPGRHGRPFKLYKFRTMQPAHDAQGKRIPDELRSSRFGSFLRRSRLDELPQLYNILVGEMSFVGPRPLLALDQPQGHSLRLLARPGLTGWAQINGGREVSTNDKAALDIWYLMNASLWLDITILLRTFAIVVCGDRVNGVAVKAARARLAKMKTDSLRDETRIASVTQKVVHAQEAT